MNFQIQEKDFSELELPDKLYKYRSWNRKEHKKIITDKEVYFAPYRTFYSKDEHNLEDDYNSIDEKKVWQFYYDNAPNHFQIYEHMERVEHADKWIQKKPWNNPKTQKEASAKFQDRLNNDFGVLCMTEEKSNYTLWNDFTGFNIGIDPKFMFKKGQIQCTAGFVNYYPPDDVPMTKVFTYSILEGAGEVNKVIYSLPDKYRGENEYRLSKNITKTGRSFSIREETVTEILIGAKMTEKSKKELIAATMENYPNAEIYEQKLDDNDKIIDYNKI